ncbi:MAG: hypothetical protein ACRDFX_03595 [Chloroflexota bacterium]
MLRLGDRLTPRWIAPLFLGFAVLLLPWVVYLAISLPTRQIAQHYRTAWVGFDIFLILALARTGWLAYQRRREVELPAVTTATLLMVDAWFDIRRRLPAGR